MCNPLSDCLLRVGRVLGGVPRRVHPGGDRRQLGRRLQRHRRHQRRWTCRLRRVRQRQTHSVKERCTPAPTPIWTTLSRCRYTPHDRHLYSLNYDLLASHVTVILKRCFIHKLHVINVDLMKSVIFIRALMQVFIPMRHKEKLIEITANP